jgi:hypothetical protein
MSPDDPRNPARMSPDQCADELAIIRCATGLSKGAPARQGQLVRCRAIA